MIFLKMARPLSKQRSCNLRLLFAAAFLLLCGTACNKPQTQSVKPSEEGITVETGIESRVTVGQEAPAFHLLDQHSVKQSLEDLLNKGKVALVFYRSADW